MYLDGTQLTGLTLPNGGVLDKLHIPNSISILSIMNQSVLSEFKVSYTDMFDGDGATESFELAQTPQTISYARVYKMDEFTGDGSATSLRLSYAFSLRRMFKPSRTIFCNSNFEESTNSAKAKSSGLTS